MNPTDSVYRIWQADQTSSLVGPEEQPVVERAMKLWTEQRRDSWLTLTDASGIEMGMLASTITATQLSTPEQRRIVTVRDKELEDERTENRRMAGYIE